MEDLIIVPLGLAFEDRVAFRGRAFVDVGPPIRMADAVPTVASDGLTASEDDHAAVDRLTAEIDAHLRACAPTTTRRAKRRSCRWRRRWRCDPTASPSTSRASARSSGRPGAWPGHRGPTARRWRRPSPTALDLRLGQLSDAEITPGPGLIGRLRKAVTALVLILVFSPLIVIGLAANVIPYLIVRLASRRVRVPVTKGTVRMLVGIAVFPITWIVLSVLLADDWEALGLFLLFAVSGFAGLWALETAPERPHGDGLAGGTGGNAGGSPSNCASTAPGWRPPSSGRWPACRMRPRFQASDGPEDASRSGVGTGSAVGHDE